MWQIISGFVWEQTIVQWTTWQTFNKIKKTKTKNTSASVTRWTNIFTQPDNDSCDILLKIQKGSDNQYDWRSYYTDLQSLPRWNNRVCALENVRKHEDGPIKTHTGNKWRLRLWGLRSRGHLHNFPSPTCHLFQMVTETSEGRLVILTNFDHMVAPVIPVSSGGLSLQPREVVCQR